MHNFKRLTSNIIHRVKRWTQISRIQMGLELSIVTKVMSAKSYGILKTITKQILQGIMLLVLCPCLKPTMNAISIIVAIIYLFPKIESDRNTPMRYNIIVIFPFQELRSLLKGNFWEAKVSVLLLKSSHLIRRPSTKAFWVPDMWWASYSVPLFGKVILHSWECSSGKDVDAIWI